MTLVVPLDPAVNPAYLKLDLYCRGMRLHESCDAPGDGGRPDVRNDGGRPDLRNDGGRPILRTRAGLGSGLELILPGELWTNVPVTERFAQTSPYELRREKSSYRIWRDGKPCADVRLAPRPAWYDRSTTSGKAMRLIGTLQGTYLGIYPGKVCDFWMTGAARDTKENCRFCSVGLNLGADDAPGKTLDDVLEVVHAAWRESGITYVDFNMGHHDDWSYLDMLEPYLRRVNEETGLLLGVQVPPHPDLSRFDRLKKLGVNRVSFCFEIFDRRLFAETCPGKARIYGLDHYLQAIEHCASLGAPGRLALEPWVTNGEIIAGLEPPESSIEAIEWLTERGAIPTVCVFRPLSGTDMKETPPPDTDALVPVFASLWTRCMERGLPIGLAPNIHVSLVLLPEECRSLVQDEGTLRALRGQERRNAVKRQAFAALLKGRRLLMGPRPVGVSA